MDDLVRMVGTLATQALRVTGSGGSYSLAAFCARLHISVTGQAAMAATPLEVVQTPYLSATGLLCLTASGRNKDIRAAFEASALAETKPTAALCLVCNSPIKGLHERYGYTDLVEAPLRIAPDGFLAVNSLLAVCVLLARAYRGAMQRTAALPPDFAALMTHCDVGEHFDRDVRRVLECGTVSVLYSPVVGAAATDLESRFVEGALGNLHAADWRNFGHGRHHWLAKRGNETGVLAFTSDGDAALARRTLATLPPDIPRAVVNFQGEADVQAICALTVALQIAEVAGSLAGIDPGRPGVPEFGRKLFGLGPRLGRPNSRHIAIARKSRVAPDIEAVLCRDYSTVTGRISAAQACGVVLDYDGTLSDRRRRFYPLEARIGQSLKRAAATGTMIGIATGRGRSAGLALQEIFPRNTWSRVLMGYYNGAVILPLGRGPTRRRRQSAGAKAVGEFLQVWFPQAQIEVRSCQVSANGFRYGQLPAHRSHSLPSFGVRGAAIVCSVFLALYRCSAHVGAQDGRHRGGAQRSRMRGRRPRHSCGRSRAMAGERFRSAFGRVGAQRGRSVERPAAMLEFGAARSARSSGRELLSGPVGRLRTQGGCVSIFLRIIRSRDGREGRTGGIAVGTRNGLGPANGYRRTRRAPEHGPLQV